MSAMKSHAGESGVSEAIGFLLIFTMVIVGIGLVTLYGYPILLNQQTSANERIMEKNMIVLQNDMKSIAYKTVPYKESSLKVEGGSLSVYKPVLNGQPFFTIGDAGVCNNYVDDFQPGELRYYSGSATTEISLQNGAVLLRRLDQTGSSPLAEPRWFYDNTTNILVMNLISMNSSGTTALSGIGTIQMAMGSTNYSQISPVAGPLCIVYNPDPSHDFSGAWDTYLMKTLNSPPDLSVSRSGSPNTGSPVTYTVTNTRPLTLVIKKYEIFIKNL